MADRELVIYSGRNRPDLGPIYELYRHLTGVAVSVEKVYHHDVGGRVVAERDDPRADVLLTNSQLAVEAIRAEGVFEPYPAPIAQGCPGWLRAPDDGWLSFTAWPRVAMINRRVLPNPTEWPQRLEDLLEPRFRGSLACASVVEMTTVAHFAALAVGRGDEWLEGFLAGLDRNDLRVYESNKETREALVREGLAAALANASNVHVFRLEGQAVGEAWLDQGPNDIGTHVEGHTVAILRGCRHPEAARSFVDFLLSVEAQEILARLYGETPVNPEARVGPVRPLGRIRRLEVPIAAILEAVPATVRRLRAVGFAVGGTT